MLSIGEFSHSTRLTVKTLRYYQELGILIPAETDDMTGYRYYDKANYERAKSIIMLKELGFTLREVSTILEECSDEKDLKFFIANKLEEVERKLKSLSRMKEELQSFSSVADESEAEAEAFEGIVEFDFQLACYAGYEISGTYEMIGKGFSRLYKQFGRFAIGKPYAFYSHLEYREGDAEMVAVIELNEKASRDSDGTKSYAPTRAVKILHKGQYGYQGSAYMKIFDYCRRKGYTVKAPVIEHFIKGPGMIFRGNPDNYLTECIVLIET